MAYLKSALDSRYSDYTLHGTPARSDQPKPDTPVHAHSVKERMYKFGGRNVSALPTYKLASRHEPVLLARREVPLQGSGGAAPCQNLMQGIS